MVYTNPLARFVILSTVILFILVFISEWKTWIDVIMFTEQKRIKRIRKEMEKSK